jgi:DNA-binding NarL/FixJ family response regulator
VNGKKTRIYYFEDDLEGLEEVVNALKDKEDYDVIYSAKFEDVAGDEVKGRENFDIVIIDIMIHSQLIEDDLEGVPENVTFEGIPWTRTGVEFLRRIRLGQYKQFGFPKDIKCIIATAAVDKNMVKELYNLGINKMLEKPFTIETMETAISELLSLSS